MTTLTSPCIERILEIGDVKMIEEMMFKLKDFLSFISIDNEVQYKYLGRESHIYSVENLRKYYNDNIDIQLCTLKTYKPFINPDLLKMIYNNGYKDIYRYILTKDLHIPK